MQVSTVRSIMNRAATRGWIVFLGSLLPALLLSPSLANGQPYEIREVNDALRQQQNLVRRILSGQEPLEKNSELLEQYFRDYLYAQMTQIGTLGKIADFRWKIKKFLQRVKDANVRSHVNNLMLKEAIELSTGNYHPAVRYNAALMIGDLDERSSSRIGANATPPRPLSSAVPVLIGFLRDDKMIDAVKVASLIGLKRHAKYELAQDQLEPVTEVLLPLLSQSKPPADRTPQGHAWLRRQAADVLAEIGSVGSEKEVHDAFMAIVAEQGLPLWLRCSVAAALSQLTYDNNTPIETEPLVLQLGGLALDVVNFETSYAEKRLGEAEEWLQEQEQGRRPGDSNDGINALVDSVFPRRRLASEMKHIRDALEAVALKKGDAPNALAQRLVGFMANMHRELEYSSRDNEDWNELERHAHAHTRARALIGKSKSLSKQLEDTIGKFGDELPEDADGEDLGEPIDELSTVDSQ